MFENYSRKGNGMRRKRLFSVLMVIALLFLSACNKNKKEENGPSGTAYDVAGKTYYNQVDDYGNNDHAKVWFGKDGTFVLNDNYISGSYEMEGDWSIKENVVTLSVKKSGVGSFDTVKFEIQDNDTLTLRTSLEGSKSGAVFSTTEIKGSDAQPGNSDVIELSFFNATQTSKNRSQLDLRSDGTFKYADLDDFGIMEVTGTFTEGDVLLTLNDLTPSGALGNGVAQIDFTIFDDDTLILMTDLGVSKKHDVFTKDGKLPEYFGGGGDSSSSGSSDPSGSETTGDIPCTGITSLYHNYWSYEGTKDWDLEIRPVPENTTDKMTFKSNDEKVVKIDEKGRATAMGPGKTTIDVTCGSKKISVGYEVRVKGGPEGAGETVTYKANMKDVADVFQPSIYMSSGFFTFTENCYAGMGQYKGTYEKKDNRIYCTVTDASSMSGFAGDDVKMIEFKIVDEKTLKLKTQLCMSGNGDLFYLVP